ncbi:DNA polymerase III subunit delta [Paracoccus sp. P2]|uniref:DNA-directed DNA polymerase n=1 Tax=Paracoccus pantotrophus TaxID=82367 RepID=A0A1I5BMG9_PARPN|nr:DNA polymerase III subunit delta [Paracoccus pantotrophus]MDF3852668.1 DNA polymerase III subunit delta [Paracoccus pantotrophus]QFG38607.1 DNA polymerase III subunit delta [Paracoccus pantotrophus]QLH16285.1 DNA polymerase III subunit delta [Paracoccus pantotrophus]RDE02071.1 DNA polymerase III subunit delta [Paracoccus pantotrophus]RKS50861.1 DNA polymerase III delta subunit [Paracoccus pantotrophus]
MILKGAEIGRYLARPDPTRPALLIHGQDAMRVALKRAEAVKALVGPGAEEEMRLTRIPGADLRKDPAALLDAVKAVGFFPGQRVVLVDDAPDAATPAVAAAIAEWKAGDAVIVVAAGSLGKSSALRKLFEPHPAAVTAPIYDDPPGEDEVGRWLHEAGLREVPRDAMRDLMALARALDPGDFRQTVEKIGLYKHGDPEPLTPAEIAALAPATIEAEVDELIDCVAEGRAREFGALMRRIEGQGIAPVTLCIAALRHFRALHAGASDPGGPGAGFSRLRPPVFGPRRDRMIRQAQDWGMRALEDAIHQLIDTDLVLRSSSRAPAMALMERMLLRLCMMPRGGR